MMELEEQSIARARRSVRNKKAGQSLTPFYLEHLST
jgi:hypothetical protein